MSGVTRCGTALTIISPMLLPRPLLAQAGEAVSSTSWLNLAVLGFALIITIAWRLSRQVRLDSSDKSTFRIVTIKRISAKNALLLVEFNGKRQLLSCCDSGISVLADLRIDRGVEGC